MLVVVLGEVVVVGEASFDFGYSGGCGVEGGGDGCEGEAVLGALVAQVRAVGDCWRVCDQLVDFSRNVAFEAAEDLTAGFAFGCAPLGVGDAAFLDAQADHGDAP